MEEMKNTLMPIFIQEMNWLKSVNFELIVPEQEMFAQMLSELKEI